MSNSTKSKRQVAERPIYIQLRPGEKLPSISHLKPFAAIVLVEEVVDPEWQRVTSTWLVESGCRYMMAWGMECASWDDSVDIANLEQFNFGEIPEDDRVMTTWHADESLSEVFWFAKNSAFHPTVNLDRFALVHISMKGNRDGLVKQYSAT